MFKKSLCSGLNLSERYCKLNMIELFEKRLTDYCCNNDVNLITYGLLQFCVPRDFINFNFDYFLSLSTKELADFLSLSFKDMNIRFYREV